MQRADTENLFKLLDDNYERYQYNGTSFWRALHALDAELTPGCIFKEEKFPAGKVTDLRDGDDTSRLFAEPSMVIRLQEPATVLKGAKLLERIFWGSGTRFVPEKVENNGRTYYQIRSNIDKAHWSKLSVFCKYRFDREIPESERAVVHAECQRTVNNYIAGTDCPTWDATEGMPAFCTLMGLHGNLRPKARYNGDVPRGDASRKESELNEAHPNGTPHIFRGVAIHVDVDKAGVVSTTPYTIGYNPRRAALERAEMRGAAGVIDDLMEIAGGNPLSKKLPLKHRIFKIGGLAGFGVALTTGDLKAIGLMAVAVVGGVILGYSHSSWEVRGHLKELEENQKRRLEELMRQAQAEKAIASPKSEPPRRNEKYFAELEEAAFSTQALQQMKNAISESAYADGINATAAGSTKPDRIAEASLASQFRGLRF